MSLMSLYRWVTVFRRLQKNGWGRGPRSPFLLRPPASERTYLVLIPWMKMASRAQQRRLASPSSLVTTASDVTYRFCKALSDCTNFSLIWERTKWSTSSFGFWNHINKRCVFYGGLANWERCYKTWSANNRLSHNSSTVSRHGKTERKHKTRKVTFCNRLENKNWFFSNSEHFERQVWVLPSLSTEAHFF